MEELIRMTAAPMQKPHAYGAFHLTFFIVGLIIVIPLALILSKKLSKRQSDFTLFSIGCLLLASEIYKQLFYTYIYGGGEYQWYMFPFQLCSIPMYVCLLLPWINKPVIKSTMYGFLASYGLMGGFVSYIAPGTMCREYYAMTIHSFSWHMILIFIGLFAALSGFAGKKLKNYLYVVISYYGMCVISLIINLLCYDKIGKNGSTVNMMYVGPHRSVLVVCRDICDKFGWVANFFVYTIALSFCAFLFYAAFVLLNKFIRKNKRSDA